MTREGLRCGIWAAGENPVRPPFRLKSVGGFGLSLLGSFSSWLETTDVSNYTDVEYTMA